MSRAAQIVELPGWAQLRHGGLLLDPARQRRVAEQQPAALSPWAERELRRRAAAVFDGGADAAAFATFVLEEVCGFDARSGTWLRGTSVGAEWGRRAITGETVKPRQLWRGASGGTLPVFLDTEARVGIGRGRKSASQVVQWLRGGDERLALLTNGRQWRLVFAGLDIDAWCEWDADLWFEEGELSGQVDALRTLIQPALWTPAADGKRAPLEQAILDSRKGQAELSAVLGERVREAVELLVQGHGEALREHAADVNPADIYRAAVRMVMRMVVVFFAESRELLPRDNALYHGSYGLAGLIEGLDKAAVRGSARLARSYAAWPRVLALCRLVYEGSSHPALPVPAYGGELFAPGDPDAVDGLTRALSVFERACFERELLPDRDVHDMLELVTRTRVRLRQGRASTWVAAPVDFSDLSSEYIGILYEGLLDFELKTAPAGDPVIFLAIGDQPALPLSRPEAMDDRTLANLLEKMKDTSAAGADAATDGEAATGDEAATDDVDAIDDDSADADVEAEEEDEEEEGGAVDERHTTRTRAEAWACRAVLAGKLVKAPRGALTPEKRLTHEAAIARKARQLVARVVLPGEWYVVRWGGTRKGSGTFYTRPGLAVPTVQRTLRPLAYDAPAGADGAPDRDAPASAWTPKPPEEILALRVCDPACGSGTFPVAALRFLTEALYESLHHHERITERGDRALVHLVAPLPAEEEPEERLGHELLPCRPDDDTFEPRLKALLRRHVVERCIYGVDLDPLAVELCRLSLWIETMDRELPFSFLDHKVKCGNALVGAWFDTFRHYPVMAFKNREGGDKGHSNGVHFEKDARTKAIKAFVKDVLTPDLRRFLGGPSLFDERNLVDEAASVHDGALATLARLHDLPMHDAGERARIYRDELLGSPAYRHLKAAMDLWCACWFWPADELNQAPLPTALAAPSEPTRALAEHLAAAQRFFHWELEFPDVFRAHGAGFDAVLGNPPWDIAKPNSKEYFSNLDPLYRSYGKQEALRCQTAYFADEAVERGWLDYNADFRAQSNHMRGAASPFGDPDDKEAGGDRFAAARGGENAIFHARWREARAKSRGYADPQHAFRHQGSADINLYKAFLEQAHALLRLGGRLGFIVPSGLYSDHGTGGLRELFLDHCRWEWLFGFENRDGIFDIHRSFKFNPVVIEKGGRTAAIHTAFMRRALEDWECAEELAVPYAREQVERFSPRSRAILEIQSARELEILEKIYANSVLLGDDGPDGWGIKYATEFHMTNDSKLLLHREKLESLGVLAPDDDVRAWAVRAKLEQAGYTPVWEGKTCYFDSWLVQPTLFTALPLPEKVTSGVMPGGVRRIARNTDARTLITCLVPAGVPTTYTIEVSRSKDPIVAVASWALLSSFVLDYLARAQVDESVPLSLLRGLPVPPRGQGVVPRLAQLVLQVLEPACAASERLRLRAVLDCVAAAGYGLNVGDLTWILRGCDLPVSGRVVDGSQLEPTGFWRVDKDKDPELRHTVLTLVAFHDLEGKIGGCGGDRDAGIAAFLGQKEGEGWMLPETVRLADYGLGHDERAKDPQPVASRLGPRFYDWQLAQSAEESWRECHLHARNLLGEQGYRELLDAVDVHESAEQSSGTVGSPASLLDGESQGKLWT